MTTCELLPRELTSDELTSPEPELTSPEPSPRDPVLSQAAVGSGLRRRRLVPLAVGVFLLPWCVVLGMTLPAGTFVPNWSLAWVGLDFAEAVAALLTAWLLGRGSPRASLPAMAGAGLLFADAWFDVCTSAAGTARLLAIGEALVVELPLAAAAIWLAVNLTRRLALHPGQG